jgi:hypothetical protein
LELDHLRQNIEDELSAHGTVGLELDPKTIEIMIREGVDKVSPWYEERVAETVTCKQGAATSTAQSDFTIYLDESDLTYAVDHVITIWAAKLDTTGLTSLTRQILGIELLQLNLGDVEEQAQWEQLLPMLRKMWDQDLRDMHIGGRIYIHGRIPDNRVTVEYARTVDTIADITNQKAINWVKDWATAKTKKVLGLTRSKYRAGGLNFETDGTELSQEANEEIRELKEQLKTLDFNYCVTR